ncbi:MAG: hypothetical protein K2F65_03505, partial [Eubacterium sp.]|nr:hypothetical protein [Eubacterium sp.]
EEGYPYLFTYEKPESDVAVYLKATHHIHTFGDLEIDKEPTCAEEGSEHRTCLTCGYEDKKVLEAKGHSWDTDYTVDKEATCTTDGSKSIHCQNCDEVKDREVISATGHTESDWIVDVEASCTTEGSRHKKCETCGKILETEVIPATGHHPSGVWERDEIERWQVCTVCGEKVLRTKHTFGELIVDKQPTCTEEGRGHRICSGCGYTEYEPIKAKGHTPAKDYETNEHERWKVCTVCGEVIERIPHTFGELIVDKQPTCTEEGRGHRICSGCGYTEYEPIKAKGHTPAKDYETNEHERWKVCTVCGEVIERIPHTFGELIVDKAPTCTEAGSGHRICSGCGYREDEIIEATGHYPSDEWETDEIERWKTCTVCGEKLQRTSHTFGKLIIDKAPTCTELGRGHRICSGCGYEESEAIKAIGHSWDSNYTVDQEPTCTTDGSRSIHCHNCDEVKDREVIPATGHIFGDWEKHNETQHKRVCKYGDAEYQNHAWNDGEETKAPTATEAGEKTFTCTVCGETKTEAIPQLTNSNVNIDTDGDGKPDINIDTTGNGKPDVNIDTTGDGKPDTNVINPIDTGSNDMFSLVFFTGIAMVAIVLLFVICKKAKKVSE